MDCIVDLDPPPHPTPISQAKHATEGNTTWGVDGDKGVLADMRELGVWEPLSVKVQTFKTAIEVSSAPELNSTQTPTPLIFSEVYIIVMWHVTWL